MLSRTHYRNEYIFWRPAVSTDFIEGELPTYRCFYPAERGVRRTMLEIIRSFDLRLPFQDLRRDLATLSFAPIGSGRRSERVCPSGASSSPRIS